MNEKDSQGHRERIKEKFLKDYSQENDVKFNNASQTLRQIARLNDEKIFFVLVLIVEAKFGKRFCGAVSCSVGRKF